MSGDVTENEDGDSAEFHCPNIAMIEAFRHRTQHYFFKNVSLLMTKRIRSCMR